MADDTIFVDGMAFFKPREGAPTFIKGNISIQPDKLIEFLKAHQGNVDDKGYLRADLKASKAGKLYVALNTWKKQ